MGLELSPQFISDLDVNWPLGTDPTLDGDNHIRNIKSVLKNVFLGEGGNGFQKQIVATEDELNHLVGTTENIQTALNELRLQGRTFLSAPEGLILAVFNNSTPVGWITSTGVPDHLMIICTDSKSGTLDGTASPIDLAHVHTNGTIKITAANLPPHAHSIPARNNQLVEDSAGGADSYPWQDPTSGQTKATNTTGSGWGTNTSIQLPNTGGATTSWDPRVAYYRSIERDYTDDPE
jgi:hypothetical protein